MVLVKLTLRDKIVLIEKDEAQRLGCKAGCYNIYDDKLYQICFLMPLLHYIDEQKAMVVLREIHDEICGNHVRGQQLEEKTL